MTAAALPDRSSPLDRAALADACRAAGADDVGLVSLDEESLAGQRENLQRAFPWARSLLVFACALHRESVRAPLRSVSSAEFLEGAHDVKGVIHRTVRRLEGLGVRAVGFSGLFPFEMGRPGTAPASIALKPLAEAAGLGRMGKSRLLLHPRFGPRHYLGAIALDVAVEADASPAPPDPCLDCNLCAAACPTGAIARDGHFDFGSCLTHNYREKLGGFVEWVHTLADSRNRHDYRRRVSDRETRSWWQSLGYEANTHCDYCVAVCPAGDEAAAFLLDRKTHYRDVVRPLRERVEDVYVVPGSDAEAHAARAFPHKPLRRIGSGRIPESVAAQVAMLQLTFQRGRSTGLAARYHLRFHGKESLEATVDIRDGRIQVERGLVGSADLTVQADSEAWLRVASGERSLLWERLLGRIRLRGPGRLLADFRRCFPG